MESSLILKPGGWVSISPSVPVTNLGSWRYHFEGCPIQGLHMLEHADGLEMLELADVPLWSVLLTLVGILTYMWSTWSFNTWSKQGISGPRPWPIFGTFLSVIFDGDFSVHDKRLVKRYGKIVGSFRGSMPTLDVADPEFLRLSMIKEFTSMPNRRDLALGNIMDKFLVFLTDDHWRHVRALLSPTFTSGKLKTLKTRIDDCAEKFLKHTRDLQGQPFDVKHWCGCFTMDTISSTAFGVEMDSYNNPNHPMRVNANKLLGVFETEKLMNRLKTRIRVAVFLLCPSSVQKLLAGGKDQLTYFKAVTSKIISERGEEDSREKDFVQLCLSQLIDDPKISDSDSKVDRYGQVWSSKGLTKEEVVANAIVFFMAGFDTTSLTLHYIFYELAMNPDVQERLYTEIQENVESTVATYEELSKMEYLDWVIQETMRIYPAVQRVDRSVDNATTVDGIHLPAGSMVSAMVQYIHHDPDIWPNPSRFDPERFSPANKEGRHQYAWIPFGIGNRQCIGMRLALLELKVAIVKIVSNFVLEPCAETPAKPLEYAKNLRQIPAKPVRLVATPRKIFAD